MVSDSDTSASQMALVVKNLSANAGDLRDLGSIPGLGRFPKEGNGNPLQYSCLENPTDRRAWLQPMESPGGGHNGSHLAQCSTQPDRWGSFTFPVVFTYVF